MDMGRELEEGQREGLVGGWEDVIRIVQFPKINAIITYYKHV